jgi:hypothetical protein
MQLIDGNYSFKNGKGKNNIYIVNPPTARASS